MVEHDKADEEAEGVVKEVIKVLLDFGVLWKHIDHLLEKNFLFLYGNIIHIGLFPSNELRNDLHCTHCDFVAPKSSKLKRHMIKHNPKPPKAEEKCPKCDMTFKYKSDLERHIPTSHRDFVKGNSRCVLLSCKNCTVHTMTSHWRKALRV